MDKNHILNYFVILSLLFFSNIEIYGENKTTKYNRKNWKHWIDADKDCQNTRMEVLIRDSLIPVKFKSNRKCRVVTGKWICYYTGKTFYKANDLDIDHVVPLKEAYISGGSEWQRKKKSDYANDLSDPHHLLAVSKYANRRKGAKDPSKWMPPKNICSYINIWKKIKKKYDLDIDIEEKKAIQKYSKNCSSLR